MLSIMHGLQPVSTTPRFRSPETSDPEANPPNGDGSCKGDCRKRDELWSQDVSGVESNPFQLRQARSDGSFRLDDDNKDDNVRDDETNNNSNLASV